VSSAQSLVAKTCLEPPSAVILLLIAASRIGYLKFFAAIERDHQVDVESLILIR
jgi:hypothetical protein